MKRIIEKVKAGDPLNNKELDQAIDHYTVLEALLIEHGDLYRLIHKDVSDELRRLKGYKEARQK